MINIYYTWDVEIMSYRYGIYQSSPKSCVFYKQDKDGNQSTFNLIAPPKEKDKVIAFIDNEELKGESWSTDEETEVEDVVEAFGGWASDAPLVFELEAQQSMSRCLSSMKKED
ncbi:MAG: hypothetical protein V5A64_04790, partial [Candidatus Thermoplasmatota archaeon]